MSKPVFWESYEKYFKILSAEIFTQHAKPSDKYWMKPVYDIFLTHCILNRLSHTIYWKSPISILGMSDYEIYIFREKNG